MTLIDVCVAHMPHPDYDLSAARVRVDWLAQAGQIATLIFNDVFTPPPTPFNLSKCRNNAAAKGNSPHILFVDCDMVPHPNTVKSLARLSQSGLALVCTGWRTADPYWPDRDYTSPPPDKEVMEWLESPLPTMESTFERIYAKANLWMPNGRYNDRYGPLFMSRSVYDTVGGFDEAYEGWGCEDDDFHHRVWTKLGKHALVASATPRFIQTPHVSGRIRENNEYWPKNRQRFREIAGW